MPVVLVVDDEIDLLTALSDALSAEGWRVLVASAPEAAFSAARSCPVDVVLCDLLLRGEDGRMLKAAFDRDGRLRRVPFVFMTASLRGQQLCCGEPVIEKPFRVAEVVEVLARRLPGGSHDLPGRAPFAG
jgi:CheY-like chemotaxis protein